MQYGSKVSGRLVPIASLDGQSKPGEIFEFHIETQGIPDEQIALQQLWTLETQFPDLRILYAETVGSKIIMQWQDIGPGFVSFGGLFSAIPAVFIIVGIIIVGYMLWQVVQMSPLLIWALVLVGGVVAFWLIAKPSITVGPILAKGKEGAGTSSKVSRKYEELESKRKALTRQTKILSEQLERHKKLKTEKQGELTKLEALTKKPIDYDTRHTNLTKSIDDLEQKIGNVEDRLTGADAKLDEVIDDLSEMI